MATTTANNSNLNRAQVAEDNDEYYTKLVDVERELKNYRKHFKGKTVLCNCDDPSVSNFYHHFHELFDVYGLKKLIATCYRSQNPDKRSNHKSNEGVCTTYSIINGGGAGHKRAKKKTLKGNGDFSGGDFRSNECIELLKEADIVVTNPPFSLFNEYISLLMKHKKKFLIIGNFNAITYKDIFPLIKSNKIWTGHSRRGMEFETPNGELKSVNACWYTNLRHSNRNEKLIPIKTYSPAKYPKYDNYKAIEVCPVKEIPGNYNGVMGVPISFLDKYNPEQYEIVGMGEDNGRGHSGGVWKGKGLKCTIKGKPTFKRLFIKQKQSKQR